MLERFTEFFRGLARLLRYGPQTAQPTATSVATAHDLNHGQPAMSKRAARRVPRLAMVIAAVVATIGAGAMMVYNVTTLTMPRATGSFTWTAVATTAAIVGFIGAAAFAETRKVSDLNPFERKTNTENKVFSVSDTKNFSGLSVRVSLS